MHGKEEQVRAQMLRLRQEERRKLRADVETEYVKFGGYQDVLDRLFGRFRQDPREFRRFFCWVEGPPQIGKSTVLDHWQDEQWWRDVKKEPYPGVLECS
eukprot:gene2475-6173_t